MKIIEITDDVIKFDNGNKITYDHEQDCCEWNYADFKQLDTIARIHEFPEMLTFEAVEDCGFRFGEPSSMFFVPCYSEQNGYYTTNLKIYYNGKEVLSFDCEFVDL